MGSKSSKAQQWVPSFNQLKGIQLKRIDPSNHYRSTVSTGTGTGTGSEYLDDIVQSTGAIIYVVRRPG